MTLFAAKEVLKKNDKKLEMLFNEYKDYFVIRTNKKLFGPPFIVSRKDSYDYSIVGIQGKNNLYKIDKNKIPKNSTLYVSATDMDFNNTISKYRFIEK